MEKVAKEFATPFVPRAAPRRCETAGITEFAEKDKRILCALCVLRGQALTHPQIGVKFGAMYRHSDVERPFRQHFFGMIVSVF
jgi:hypothetical protein